MRTERTNFEGSWDDICPHCGSPQEDHRKTYGPFEGVLHEHRLPCEPEKKKMQRDHRRIIRTGKIIVFIGWILVPLVILLLTQFVMVIGWIAFAFALIMLSIETIKHFGNPNKWIPGYKVKKEKELKMAHYFYHCDRNPDGFNRLLGENLKRMEEENEGSVDPET